MGLRIRYSSPNLDGVKISKQIYFTGDGLPIKIYLNESEFWYKITNQLNMEVLIDYKDGTKNLNVLKRFIRRDLDKLGVELGTEKRNREAADKGN